ncbi:MAG: endonuclease NucS domain-containing protein [Candidatus Bathyarchaeia archaeon]
MYKFVLYYEKKALYQNKINTIIEGLKEIKSKWKVDFNIIDTKTLSKTQIEQVKNDIRNIKPQLRGKIVSAKNKVLPFSKNKNLNTTNTPILVLYHDKRPINVYPHMLGTMYFEIETQLENILKNGPEAHMIAKGLLEEPMQKILADNPSILEKGMQFKDANKDVGFGVADVILQDANGKTVVVEIETKATETAVAQVSRLAAGYTSQSKLPINVVRKVILCQHFDEKTANACKGANIELYKLTTEKIC